MWSALIGMPLSVQLTQRNFRGSPGCHEIFHPRNFPLTVTCFNLDRHGDVLFCNLCSIDYTVDLRDPLSQAAPRVIDKK